MFQRGYDSMHFVGIRRQPCGWLVYLMLILADFLLKNNGVFFSLLACSTLSSLILVLRD